MDSHRSPSSADVATQDRISAGAYNDIQSRLEAMSYTEPLAMESIPLVTHLIDDLTRVTEQNLSLKHERNHVKHENAKLFQQKTLFQKENAFLLQENSQLHLELIQQEEHMQTMRQKAEIETISLKEEAKKLQFQNDQLRELVEKHERTIASLQRELEEMISSANDIQMEGAVSSCIQMNANAPVSTDKAAPFEPYAVDSKASAIVSRLQSQLDTLKQEYADLEAVCTSQKQQIAKRDKDIQRISSTRYIRSPQTEESKEQSDEHDIQIEKLQSHIDFLTDQVAKYERKLKELGKVLKEQDQFAQKLTQANQHKEQLAMELQAMQTRYALLQEKHEDMQQHKDQADEETSPPVIDKTAELEELLQQKHRLEDALRASHYEKLSYTNALNNALAHHRILSSDLAQSHAKVKAISTQYSQSSQALTELKSRYAAQERELNVLRASLHQANEQKTAEGEKNLVLHRELRAMDTVIAQRDADCQELRRSIAEYQCQLQVLERERTCLAPIDQKDTSDRFQIIAEQERKWLAQTREEMRMEREQWASRVTELETSVAQLRLELQSSNLEREQLQKAKLDLELLQKQKEDELDEKTRALQTQQRKILEKCQEIGELQALRDDQTSKNESLEKLQSEKNVLQSRVASLDRQCNALKEENIRLQHVLENLEQRERHNQEILRKKTEELVTLEQQNRSYLHEKQQFIAEKEALSMEIAGLRQRASRNEIQCVELTRDAEAEKLSRSELESLFHAAKLDISERDSRLNTIQKQLIEKIAQLQQLEIQLHDAKRNTRNAEMELEMAKEEKSAKEESIENLQAALRRSSASLQKNQLQLQETEQKLAQCELLLDTMQNKQNRQQYELQQLQQTNEKLSNEISVLKQTISSSDAELEKHQTLILQLREKIQKLEHAKDQICDDMDVKLQDFQALQEKRNELHNQVEDLQSQIASHVKQNEQFIQELDRQETAFQELQSQMLEKTEEIRSLTQERTLFKEERRAFFQDLENMTSENQRLNESCVQLEYAMENERQRVSEMKQYLQQMERERDVLSIEKEDLEKMYRQLAQEHTQLKNARVESHASREELIAVNNQLRATIRSKEEELASVSSQYRQIQMESMTYRDQISQVTEALREKEEVLLQYKERQKQLEDEMETQKQISTEISAQRFGAEAQRATSAQKLIALQAKLSSYQIDKKKLLEQIQQEQLKNRKLENIASQLRQKLMESEKQLEAVKEQRDILSSEIMFLHRQGREHSPNMELSDLYTSPSNVENGKSPSIRQSLQDNADSLEDKDSPNMLPFNVLLKAREKCQHLEDQLNKQDATIKQLERSRSKFKRFVIKYEQEIEQRDRIIQQLKSSASSVDPNRSNLEYKEHLSS